jgi:hypothetical protein
MVFDGPPQVSMGLDGSWLVSTCQEVTGVYWHVKKVMTGVFWRLEKVLTEVYWLTCQESKKFQNLESWFCLGLMLVFVETQVSNYWDIHAYKCSISWATFVENMPVHIESTVKSDFFQSSILWLFTKEKISRLF